MSGHLFANGQQIQAFRRFSRRKRKRKLQKLKMVLERVNFESTFGEYESAATGGDSIGRWTGASAGRGGQRQDARDYPQDRLSD